MTIAKSKHLVGGVEKLYDVPRASAPMDPSLAIGLGMHPHLKNISINGYSQDANAGDTVWSNSGPYLGFDAVDAEPLIVVSTDANDEPSGAGSETILIEGLDANLEPIEELVVMVGTSPTSTLQSFLRVNDISTVDGDVAAGDITLTQDTSGILMGVISEGQTGLRGSFYTVPNGYGFFIQKIYCTMERSGAAEVTLGIQYRRPNTVPWITSTAFIIKETSPFIADIIAIEAPEGYDLRVYVIDNSTNDSFVHVVMAGVLANLGIKHNR